MVLCYCVLNCQSKYFQLILMNLYNLWTCEAVRVFKLSAMK